MNFYDKVVDYSDLILTKGTLFLKNNTLQLFTISLIFFAGILSSKVSLVVHNMKNYQSILTEIEDTYSFTIKQKDEGIRFQTNEGMISSYRLVTSENSYQLYFIDDNFSQYYLLENKGDKWLTEPLEIPPVISQAFIRFDIGLVDSYQQGIAIVDDKEYKVQFENNRAKIEGVGVYAPLPPVSQRSKKFIEGYIGTNYEELEYISSKYYNNRELMYIYNNNAVYSIELFFDGSIKIATGNSNALKIKEDMKINDE